MLAHLPPHPNVVQYFGCWVEPAGEGEHLYLQLEKCDVNLGIHASLGEQLREAELVEVLRQVGWRPGPTAAPLSILSGDGQTGRGLCAVDAPAAGVPGAACRACSLQRGGGGTSAAGPSAPGATWVCWESTLAAPLSTCRPDRSLPLAAAFRQLKLGAVKPQHFTCAAPFADGVCAGAPAPPRCGPPGRQARQHLPAGLPVRAAQPVVSLLPYWALRQAARPLQRSSPVPSPCNPNPLAVRPQDVPEEEAAPCGGAPAVRYKLGDFGLATRLNLRTQAAFDEGDCRWEEQLAEAVPAVTWPSIAARAVNSSTPPVTHTCVRTSPHSTPPCSYLPLEVLNGELGQLHKADMFSLGATLLELATRAELPSGGQQYQDLRAGKLPLLPTCTQRFANMIRWGGRRLQQAHPCMRTRAACRQATAAGTLGISRCRHQSALQRLLHRRELCPGLPWEAMTHTPPMRRRAGHSCRRAPRTAPAPKRCCSPPCWPPKLGRQVSARSSSWGISLAPPRRPAPPQPSVPWRVQEAAPPAAADSLAGWCCSGQQRAEDAWPLNHCLVFAARASPLCCNVEGCEVCSSSCRPAGGCGTIGTPGACPFVCGIQAMLLMSLDTDCNTKRSTAREANRLGVDRAQRVIVTGPITLL